MSQEAVDAINKQLNDSFAEWGKIMDVHENKKQSHEKNINQI